MESVFSIIGSEGLEVSLTSLLHGEQKITIHKDIPSSGKATTKAKITAVEDYKKFGSVTIESDSYMDGEKIATSESVMLFIGEGGFGVKPKKKEKLTVPKTDPDKVLEYKTLDNQAILYRIPSGVISLGKPIRYLSTRYDATSYHPGLCNVGGDVELGNYLSFNNLI